jgi:hypothetical protein
MAAETLNAYRKIQTGSRRTRHRSDEPKANSSTSTGRMETTSSSRPLAPLSEVLQGGAQPPESAAA